MKRSVVYAILVASLIAALGVTQSSCGKSKKTYRGTFNAMKF